MAGCSGAGRRIGSRGGMIGGGRIKVSFFPAEHCHEGNFAAGLIGSSSGRYGGCDSAESERRGRFESLCWDLRWQKSAL